jgi:FkbM family methyltransferase
MRTTLRGKLSAAAILIKKYGLIPGLRVAVSLQQVKSDRSSGTVREVWIPGFDRPVFVRTGTSDIQVLAQILVKEELGFELPGSPARIVDAGANIGLASLFLHRRFPTAQIVSLEIEDDNFRTLQKNLAGISVAKPLKVGLWSKRCRIAVANPEATSWEFRAAESSDSASGIDAVGVADLMSDMGWDSIDLLKIDIEGGEAELFASDVSHWARRVRVIAIEIHEAQIPGIRSRIYEALTALGFNATRSGEYHVFTQAARS